MKLNGALKPRHGASIEGSSPGAGQLRKYRDKRYPKDTCRHAVNGCFSQQQQRQHQFSACGVNNTNSKGTNNNQSLCQEQQKTQEQEQQQPQPPRRHSKKCGETSLGSNEEGTALTNINNTNIKQNRIKSAVREPTGGSGNHDDDAVITLKQKQQLYITTRQTNNKSSDKPNTSKHNKQDKRHTDNTANSGVGEDLPIANYHVTPPGETNINNNKTNNSKRSKSKGNNTTTTNWRPHCWKEVNKLSLVWKIYEPLFWRALPFSTVIISRLFKQFKSFLLWFAFFMFSAGSTTGGKCGGGAEDCGPSRRVGRVARHSSLVNIMRASQSFVASLNRICFKNAFKSRLPLTTTTTNSIALCLLVYGAAATMLLPQPVFADDGDNFFSPNGIAIGEATTEFDYASRGQKKFGDKCDNTLECGFPGSICDTKKKSCQCTDDLPITNHIDKCGKEAAVNESCFFNEQCESKYFQTECRDGRCVCRFDMTPMWLKDGSVECKGRQDKKGPETYIDPAMIGVLIGMALMFIIICVVLRLFSQARWRENRTIFNTPNPRLMNVSLLRESKLLHGQERRGSRMSVRAPSRQPSMASLRPHSPNPSLGSRSNSHGSNASATSLRSTRSNSVSPAINNAHHERKGSTYHPHQHHQHHQHHTSPPQSSVQQQQHLQQPNIIANPVAESVTVDIIEPEK